MEKGQEFFLIVPIKSFYNGGGYSAHKKPFHTGEGYVLKRLKCYF